MQGLFVGYVTVVIALLALSTTIRDDDSVSLTHILIAAFAWPLCMPIIAARAWIGR